MQQLQNISQVENFCEKTYKQNETNNTQIVFCVRVSCTLGSRYNAVQFYSNMHTEQRMLGQSMPSHFQSDPIMLTPNLPTQLNRRWS